MKHTCCRCGHRWESLNREDEKAILKSVEVNRQGPYCSLCLFLCLASRCARTRGDLALANNLDAIQPKP